MSGEGWRSGRIADLVSEVSVRVDPQALADPETPYIGLEDIGQGTGTLLSIGRAGDASSQKSGFLSGDILFGKLRPNLKKVVRPDFDGVCSTDIVAFRAKSNADPAFAFSVLSSDFAIDHAVAHAAGTKMPRAHARSVLDCEIIIPPLDEQRRIAEVLRSVDEAVDAAQEVSDLEALIGVKLVAHIFAGSGRSRHLQETELGVLPSDWSVKEWGSLCSMVGVGIASSATHAYSSEGIPLIRNQNILFGSLDLNDLLRVTPEYDQQYASKRLKTGDVITMRTGYPGRSAVVPPELDRCQTFTTLISRPQQDLVLPSYLCGWINSERGRREVLRLQAGGAQQNLNAGSLRHLLVPVPPMAEQKEIVETLQGFERNRTIEQSFAGVRDAIRSDLLSGHVRVPA